MKNSLPVILSEAKNPIPANVTTGLKRSSLVALWVLLVCSALTAQTLTGTVHNATTGKPAAGDQVVLIKLGQGMEEAGRTTADAKGNFSFKLDSQGPHLVRAIHQDVTYHRMAPPGTTSVDVEVYDVGQKIEGIEVVADIMRLQVEQGQLEIVRAFAVQNKSKPPRTQMNERNLEFYVPEGAQIIDGSAMTENGNPLTLQPVQEREKNRYAFMFPLRPGTTQFQVAYQLPYTGSANVDPKTIYPLEHFVAIVPKSMQFTSAVNDAYKTMNDPKQPDATVLVASEATVGQQLAFKISGEGVLQQRGQNDEQAGGANAAAPGENRPGGGLGPPIDAPDPLHKYQWWILGGLAAVLVVGAVYTASRQQSAQRALIRSKNFNVEDLDVTSDPGGEPPQRTSKRPSSMLLEGIKEELFELEIERKQGQITQQEYDKAKAALDQTLERALKREAAKQA